MFFSEQAVSAAPAQLRSLRLPVIVLISLLIAADSFSQTRPEVRPLRRDYFAGRLLLVPRNDSPALSQFPRLIAQVADHEIVLPPRSLLRAATETQRPEKILAWIKSQDFAEADGLILDRDLFTETQRAELLDWISRKRSGLPVLTDGADLTLQVARQLNRRFGLTPKILPAWSANAERIFQEQLSLKINAAGAIEMNANDSRRADVLFFIHSSPTSAQQFESFINALATSLDSGARAALADVTTTPAERERLNNEIRNRRWLDRLYAYAAQDHAVDAISATLAQASARFVAARFLRDDDERLRRIESAQIELLLNRWLTSAVYEPTLRATIETFAREQLRTDPEKLDAATDRAEEFATRELRPLIGQIFSEQFRNNVHSVLLPDGERAEFRVRAIQRFRCTFPTGKISEPEISPRVYLFRELKFQSAESRAEWELKGRDDLDRRLINRYYATPWSAFETAAAVVELNFKLTTKAATGAEGYAIHSSLKKGLRRIEVTAATVQGAFYAFARLEQLGVAGKLAQDFQLAESPAFQQRGVIENFSAWSHRDRADVLRFLGRTRMNRYFYAPQDDALRGERWRENYAGNELFRFKELLRIADENFVELVYTISPGNSIVFSSDEDFTALTRKLDQLSALGIRHFALVFDEASDTLQSSEDRARFSSLAAAHAHFINRTREYLQRKPPAITLTTLPAAFNDAQRQNEYLKELGAAVAKDVQFFQTAPESFSSESIEAQSRAGSSLTNRAPLLLDRFPSNETEPWRLFLGAKRGASATLNEAAAGFIARPMLQAHASMLPLATIADYAWNPRGYDPDDSLGRALMWLYDKRSEAALRVWSNAFRSYQDEASAFAPLIKQTADNLNVPVLERWLGVLRPALESIGVTRERGLLRGQLFSVLVRLENSLAQLKNNPAYEKLPDGTYRRRSSPAKN